MTLNNQYKGSNARLLSFDDIVFENRNKEYGSYDIRRRYMVSLLYASIFSISVITITVVCPMIYYNYFHDETPIVISQSGTFSPIDIDDLKPNEVLPDLPAMKTPVLEAPSFVAPRVVDNADTNATTFATPIDIIENTSSTPYDGNLNPTVKTPTIDDIPEIVETMAGPEEPAMFKGGDLNAFHKWVQEQLVYPQAASEMNVQGRVLVQFTVGPKGMIDDIKVVRSVDPLLDNEVVRVLKQSPLWSEPRQSGRAVKQQFYMPVFFQLRE